MDTLQKMLLILFLISTLINGNYTNDENESGFFPQDNSTSLDREDTAILELDQYVQESDGLPESSEIVESYALPEGSNLGQPKNAHRPKRRRRRKRRRKQKPIVTGNQTESESYYLIVEEHENGPVSYTLTDNLQGLTHQKTQPLNFTQKQEQPNLEHELHAIEAGKKIMIGKKNQNPRRIAFSEGAKNGIITKSVTQDEIENFVTPNSKENTISSENTVKSNTNHSLINAIKLASNFIINTTISKEENRQLKFKEHSRDNFKHRQLSPSATTFLGKEIFKNYIKSSEKIEQDGADKLSDKLTSVLARNYFNLKNKTNENFDNDSHLRSSSNDTFQNHYLNLPPVEQDLTLSKLLDNTAFIYISCNKSLHEIIKKKFNFSDDRILNPRNLRSNRNLTIKTIPEKKETIDFVGKQVRMIDYLSNLTNEIQSGIKINEQNFKFVTVTDEVRNQSIKPFQTHSYPPILRKNKTVDSGINGGTIDAPNLERIETFSPSNLFLDSIEHKDHLTQETEFSTNFKSALNKNSVNKTRFIDRRKLSLAVKTGIIISGGILALAVLSFFTLLLSCKIRQEKLKLKCQSQLHGKRKINFNMRQNSTIENLTEEKRNELRPNYDERIKSIKPPELRQSLQSIAPPRKLEESRFSFRSTSPFLQSSEFCQTSRNSFRSTSPILNSTEYMHSFQNKRLTEKGAEFIPNFRNTCLTIDPPEHRQSFRNRSLIEKHSEGLKVSPREADPILKAEKYRHSFRNGNTYANEQGFLPNSRSISPVLKSSKYRQSFRSDSLIAKHVESQDNFGSMCSMLKPTDVLPNIGCNPEVTRTGFLGRSFRASVRSDISPNMNRW